MGQKGGRKFMQIGIFSGSEKAGVLIPVCIICVALALYIQTGQEIGACSGWKCSSQREAFATVSAHGLG